MNPSGKSSKRGFVADDNTTEIMEPAMGSLDFEAPTISATGTPVLSGRLLAAFPMRANQLDAAFIEQSFAKRITIRRTIINQMFGNSMGKLKPIQRWLDQLHFIVVGPR